MTKGDSRQSRSAIHGGSRGKRAAKAVQRVPTVLLTGFEPFGGEQINPSQEIVRQLDGKTIAGHRIAGRILPVAFADTLSLLERWIDELQPVLILAIGQAGGRAELSLERVAINLVDARIADNVGAQPIDTPVIADAPAAYFTKLPVKVMAAAMCAKGVPTTLSFSAGSYVCNQVFFALCHALSANAATTRSGFMHVPWLPVQSRAHPGEPTMALATMLRGVRIALECALATVADDRSIGGSMY